MHIFYAATLLAIVWTVAVVGQYIMCYFYDTDAWWYIVYTSLIGSAMTFFVFYMIKVYIADLIQ